MTTDLGCPYKGLASYEDSEFDVRFFFGREREREVICANLMASKLTVLYGDTGVGKSSVLRAGVAHSLRARGDEAKTGQDQGEPFRLGKLREVYASPVGAAGRIYVTSRDGVTQVMSHEAMPELLATNRLDDSISASAALVGRELFLRGEKALYCIAEK